MVRLVVLLLCVSMATTQKPSNFNFKEKDQSPAAAAVATTMIAQNGVVVQALCNVTTLKGAWMTKSVDQMQIVGRGGGGRLIVVPIISGSAAAYLIIPLSA
ncbi:hypothetical protein AND_004002 [Anopheles darlingi]|uniref:Secreted protein n=1 Tax=Anopheles darlingi TaxID=43151 RepID=W5JNA4_ANODA|nr:hypothetical protein AND_004002 [Anopheles darlingi]